MVSPYQAGALIMLMIVGMALPTLFLLKAAIVDQSLDTGVALVGILTVFVCLGLAWRLQGTIWMFVILIALLGGCMVLPYLGAAGTRREMHAMDNEDIAKYQAALQHDPNNASACGFLGDAYFKQGRYELAIPAYEKAIRLRPGTEQSVRWQRRLQDAQQAKGGVSGHSQLNFAVCHGCQRDVPAQAMVCPRCGTTLQMGMLQWLAKPEIYRDVMRATVGAMLFLIILTAVLSALPLEVKACVAMATVIVGAYYFLRGIGPNAPLE